jgi:amino acid adenylation domain-containing protein
MQTAIDLQTATPGRILFAARLLGVELSGENDRLRVRVNGGSAGGEFARGLESRAADLRAFLARQQDDRTTVVDLFERIASERPDALAVSDARQAVTYGELEGRANRLARHLTANGCRLESRVGVLLPRSVDWITAILATLKAGGCYVPLDPSLPAERIGEACRNQTVQMLLSEDAHLADLPEFDVLYTPKLTLASAASQPSHAPGVAIAPRQLAYILTTSGSTGTPKAVMIEHQALANLVRWHVAEYLTDARGCRATQLAASSFDAHIWEIFPYLCSGAALFIVDRQQALDLPTLAQWMKREAITHSFMPTPLAETFFKISDERAEAPELRFLLVGGDVLRQPPPTALPVINHYGPTEAAVVATYSYCDNLEPTPPIGLSISGVDTVVMTPGWQPAAPLAVGELCLGGTGLGRGYLQDPAATALAFVPDPAGEGRRLYRTRDLAIRLEDGQLKFVGRADLQLKVRGVRIEPAEVEHHLLAHPAVREAAVVKHNMRESLVAFCAITDGDSGPSPIPQQQVSDWKRLYDATYSGADEDEFIGWNSSYDGRPLPIEDMRAWADEVCGRIRELGGRRVLEIGAGTGILLSRLLPHVDSYAACDVSSSAITRLGARLATVSPVNREKVSLFEAAAHEITDLEPRSFDVIILNSVVQYFPDTVYMDRVLETAAGLLREDGAIFIGDVRDMRLQDAFAASLALSAANPGVSLRTAAAHRQGRIEKEQELLLAPRFFRDWADRHGGFNAIAMPKAGRYDNEVYRFRFDTILRKAGEDAGTSDIALTWPDIERCGWPTVEEKQSFIVEDIPHWGVFEDVWRAAQLADAARLDNLTVADLTAPDEKGIRPQVLLDQLKDKGWRARAILDGQKPGRFAVQAVREADAWPSPPPCHEAGPLANAPAANRRRAQVVSELRGALRQRLPSYMTPENFVILDALPLTDTGKIDRRALADHVFAHVSEAYVPPASPLETLIAQWFSEVLGTGAVGRTHNLFDLGGNSLTAARISARFNAETGLELPLGLILESRSIADLAEEITRAVGGAEAVEEILAILNEQIDPNS